MERLGSLARRFALEILSVIVTVILQKLGLRDRVQAVVLAYQTGLLERAPEE